MHLTQLWRRGNAELTGIKFLPLTEMGDLKGLSLVVLVVKNQTANAGDVRHEFNPWVGKIPWRRARQPSPVFLPGESHRQKSLGGLQSTELDMTEVT